MGMQECRKGKRSKAPAADTFLYIKGSEVMCGTIFQFSSGHAVKRTAFSGVRDITILIGNYANTRGFLFKGIHFNLSLNRGKSFEEILLNKISHCLHCFAILAVCL